MWFASCEGITAREVSYDLGCLCLGGFVWPYVKRSRHVGDFEMFRVALYEVHTVSNFGSPPLYFDRWQHRDAILESVAASSVQPPCGLSVCSIENRAAQYVFPLRGSLYFKGSQPGQCCMTLLTSAFRVLCGLM